MATRLFSGQELSALRRDASFRRQIAEGLVMEVEPSAANLASWAGGGKTAGHQGSQTTGSEVEKEKDGRGAGGAKGDPIAGGLKDRDPKNWSEISWKSVCLARKESERRGRGITEEPGTSTILGDIVSPQKGVTPVLQGEGGIGTNGGVREAQGKGKSRVLQETEASAMRQHARKREDNFIAGGAQNFYKPVRVCASCFRVCRLHCVFYRVPIIGLRD